VEAETIGDRGVQSTVSRATSRPQAGESGGGDPFAEAVVAHHEALARLAYALCGDLAQAEDAVAEAYAKVWPRWRRGKVDNLYAYLRRTVVNEVYGKHRRRRLERREAMRPPERPSDGRFESQVDDRDALWNGLARLPTGLRVVVVLRIVEDLSEERTAAMLGIPAGTVKSRLSRGLAILRAAVDHGHD
jgi:RNA polymerase sigma-70 factor (sigma-E family)